MNNILPLIKNLFKAACERQNITGAVINLKPTTHESHGDLTTNIALTTNAGNARQLAQALVDDITSNPASATIIERIEVAGPGFINLFLHPSIHLQTLQSMLDHPDSYGQNSTYSNKKIVVEYTDPNPFKQFHIGHVYSNIVGETIARMYEASGATVWRADYFGDVGMHVAKSIWGLIQKISQDHHTLDNLAELPLTERIAYLGQAYAKGNLAYEESPQAIKEMKSLNALIYSIAQKHIVVERVNPPKIDYSPYLTSSPYDEGVVKELYLTCRQWSLEYFETIYERLGTRFNGYYPESMMAEYGYELVKKHIGSVFMPGENGAIIYPGKKHGLHDRVFINSLGLPTYECKELGLAPAKYEDFPYDQSIIVTGNEINEYFHVLIHAMKQVLPPLGNVTTHLGHGMVRLPQGKMSSRTGNVISGEWLMDDAVSAALAIIEELNPTLPSKEIVAEQVGLAALRYALLKTNIGSNVIFSTSEQVTFDGNSGPYLQYTHARCRSVLTKANSTPTLPHQYQFNPEETALIRSLTQYPDTVKQATHSLSPHLICNYLYDLAQRYNTFYHRHSILGSESKLVDEPTKHLRLSLTQATAQVIKNGLHLLGIHAPETM
jgi:arginyl-tRNA synthetase